MNPRARTRQRERRHPTAVQHRVLRRPPVHHQRGVARGRPRRRTHRHRHHPVARIGHRPRTRRQAGQGGGGVIHCEVYRIRGASARRRIGHYDRIPPRRGQVARAQGDLQLRRAYMGHCVGHPIVGDRRGGEKIRASDGQGLRRRPRRGRGGRKAVMVGTGLFTVKFTAFEAPPPGAGLVTTTA